MLHLKQNAKHLQNSFENVMFCT